jgi:hypothetical protein
MRLTLIPSSLSPSVIYDKSNDIEVFEYKKGSRLVKRCFYHGVFFNLIGEGLDRNEWRKAQAPEKALLGIFSVQTLILGIGRC